MSSFQWTVSVACNPAVHRDCYTDTHKKMFQPAAAHATPDCAKVLSCICLIHIRFVTSLNYPEQLGKRNQC